MKSRIREVDPATVETSLGDANVPRCPASSTSSSRGSSRAWCSSRAATSRARPRTNSLKRTSPSSSTAWWHPQRVRRRDAAGPRLHRRRVDGGWLRPLEERGPAGQSRCRAVLTAAAARPLPASPSCPRSASAASTQLLESKILLRRSGRARFSAVLYLAAAGCRHARHRRHGRRRRSNLQRQILHTFAAPATRRSSRPRRR